MTRSVRSRSGMASSELLVQSGDLSLDRAEVVRVLAREHLDVSETAFERFTSVDVSTFEEAVTRPRRPEESGVWLEACL
jgi:hypothetical protein